MASQVLSGTGDVSYTNNTGQNVRVIINYCSNLGGGGFTGEIVISWAGVSVTATTTAFGRNLAFNPQYAGSSNMQGGNVTNAPTELMLAPGQTFSLSAAAPIRPNGPYNIVVIPEAG